MFKFNHIVYEGSKRIRLNYPGPKKKKRTERLQKIKLLEFIFPSLNKSDYCKKIKTTFSILELSEVNLYYQNTADACFLQPRSAYIFNSFKHQIILKDGQRFNLQH